MTQYLFINVMLTCGALLINHLMHIPHRMRFYVLMGAMTAWLIPFGMLSIEISKQTIEMLPIHTIQIDTTQSYVLPENKIMIDWLTIFYTMILLGFVRFCFDLITSTKLINQLKLNSKTFNNHKNIRLTKGINGAFVSGYFNPIIWIDEQLQLNKTLTTVIAHEQQHIKNHDQFWLFSITLIQRLFWFNPLTHYLCQKTRQSIELRCDEDCKNKLGQEQYRSHLAELFINNNRKNHSLMNNQINHNQNFNIHRVKQLTQENSMNNKNKTQLTLIILSIVSMSSISLISIGNELKPSDTEKKLITLDFIFKTNNGEPGEFSIIAKQGEMVNISSFETDFGFIVQTSETDSELIYTDIIISEINNGIKSEVANPGILSKNKEWASFQFDDEETYYDVSIRPTISDNTDPEIEAIDNYLDKNDPAPTLLGSKTVPKPSAVPVPQPAPTYVTDQKAIPTVPFIAAPKTPPSPPEPVKGH